MHNSKKWDEKYKERDMYLREPEDFIVDNIFNMKKGTLLDLASGDGRNSLFLSTKGFDVTSADFSLEALKRLEYFSYKEALRIKTALLDLTTRENLLFLGKFDNIVINHYKIESHLLPTLESMLNTGGRLLYCTFSIKEHEATGFNKDYCLDDTELEGQLSLKLLKHESIKSKYGYIEGYIFSK